ncbi:MAG: flagellar modification protein B [Candidatus Marinimicrobia bacterium]|nr:flagellar modification protein B [Candidatus Neomarinimicrobiota bacterium]|tara:strand:+ start:2024 stop:2713 length:690 start_codon:yes stop_codon:yes gene_type:complete
MNVLCTICARGGSKGLKNKNILLFKNMPLISHTIKIAKKSKVFSKIVISSDSQKILNISKKENPNLLIKRPYNLSNSRVLKVLAIRHALKVSETNFKMKFDYIVDLDITSPIRKTLDIQRALKKIVREKNEILVSAIPSKKNPYFNMVEFDKKRKLRRVKNISKKVYNRQGAPKVYDMNASIYIWKRKTLLTKEDLFYGNTSLYIMKNQLAFDIDTNFDYKILKKIYNL